MRRRVRDKMRHKATDFLEEILEDLRSREREEDKNDAARRRPRRSVSHKGCDTCGH